MSFWDLVKKGAKAVKEQVTNFNEDVKKYKSMYEDYDTERLKSMYRSSSKMAKKMAIANILKERGEID